jgi:hypothetical protein
MNNKHLHVDKFKQKGQIKKIHKISWDYLNSLNINGLFNFGSEERIDTSSMNSYRKGIWHGKEK